MNNDDILEKQLRSIFDDEEFIICIFAQLKTEKERKLMSEYIKNNPNSTSEEITLLSISLKRKEINI